MNEIICPYCGQQNPAGAQFCIKCAAGIASPQQVQPPPPQQLVMQQPYAQPQQPYYASLPTQFGMMPPPAKNKTPLIIAVVVIAVVAIVLIAVMFMFGCLTPAEQYAMDVGDYIIYSYTGTGSFISFSGTMEMMVTAETSTTYTITISYTGDFYLPPESYTFSKSEMISDSGAYGDLGTYVGQETITTGMGSRSCKIYSDYDPYSGFAMRYYIGSSNGVLYKMTMEMSGMGNLNFELSDTNIGWI